MIAPFKRWLQARPAKLAARKAALDRARAQDVWRQAQIARKQALAARHKAYVALKSAEDRGDTRDQGRAIMELRESTKRLLEIEVALNPSVPA